LIAIAAAIVSVLVAYLSAIADMTSLYSFFSPTTQYGSDASSEPLVVIDNDQSHNVSEGNQRIDGSSSNGNTGKNCEITNVQNNNKSDGDQIIVAPNC
jgi:hypothetical protein